MTVKELLQNVVCNVEVYKPADGKKVFDFSRNDLVEVDVNEYNDAEVYMYKFLTKDEYLEYLADTHFDEELYMANYGNEPVLVIIVKPDKPE